MTKSRFDIANAAISIFLQDVGRFYDQARGFAVFEPTAEQMAEVLTYFSAQCCYCGSPIRSDCVVWDRLIPMDKRALGLHAWGNVVPCCESCQQSRRQRTWRELLNLKCDRAMVAARTALIENFAVVKRYDLDLNLHLYADNLYEDAGAVAMTLIQLRYKQAEQKIRATLAMQRTPYDAVAEGK